MEQKEVSYAFTVAELAGRYACHDTGRRAMLLARIVEADDNLGTYFHDDAGLNYGNHMLEELASICSSENGVDTELLETVATSVDDSVKVHVGQESTKLSSKQERFYRFVLRKAAGITISEIDDRISTALLTNDNSLNLDLLGQKKKELLSFQDDTFATPTSVKRELN